MNIGDILKEEREKRKLSIANVAFTTRINKKYIQALEDGNYLIIPSPVFAKGFLKAYAEFLDLDPRPMMDELLKYYKSVDDKKNPSIKQSSQKPIRYNAMYILYAAITLLLVVFIAYEYSINSGRPVSSIPAATPEAQAAEIKPALKLKVKPVVTRESAANVVKNTGVKVYAIIRTKVTVISDGSQAYNGTLEPGYWVIFRGKEVKVSSENAGGVKIFVNGVDMGSLGEAGQSAEKVFNPYK